MAEEEKEDKPPKPKRKMFRRTYQEKKAGLTIPEAKEFRVSGMRLKDFKRKTGRFENVTDEDTAEMEAPAPKRFVRTYKELRSGLTVDEAKQYRK